MKEFLIVGSFILKKAMSGKVKKYIDECRDSKNPELELVEKGIVSLPDVPGLCKYGQVWLLI